MKLVYQYEVSQYIPEEDEKLSEEELYHKYFEYYYDYFRMLKDSDILDPSFFTRMLGMNIEEEEPGERERVRKIKLGEWKDVE